MKYHLTTFLTFCLLTSLCAQQGLKAEYYNGTNFDEKVVTQTDAQIDMGWNNTPPVPGINPHECSIRWTGLLTSPETGTYTFSARVDDGIRVWVGGVQVIDAWDLNDNGHFTGQIGMKAGRQYDLKVEYFNALIEGEVSLLWQLPSSSEPVVVEGKYLGQTLRPVPKPTPVKPAENKPVAPKPTPPAPKPQVKKPVVTQQEEPAKVSADTLERYVPKNVLFERGKSVILPESTAGLDKLAGFLLRNSELALNIEGHTDIIGDADLNQTLSEERAKVVARYLTAQGIEESRIEAKGYGSSRPLVKGNFKKGYPRNRRVAFIIK